MEQNNYKLIIFDIDGTLADRDTNVVLTGVTEWFEAARDNYIVALATNQGGVGLRWWMVKDGFGNPDDYPDEADALNHVASVVNQLPLSHYGRADLDLRTYICYAYQSKKSGKWNPIPEGKENDWRWMPDYRKPAPGMLLKAMQDCNISALETLMVGDSEEDEQAAKAAGCAFAWSSNFFQCR